MAETITKTIGLSFAMAAALLLSACGDPGTVSVEILAYDQQQDDYDFEVVDIVTLDDIDRLKGRATNLIGGADITLDYQKNQLMRDEPGRAVSFGAFESGGALVPEDFDSLAMVSAYYNIERSLLFFESLGMERGFLVEMETYYWPDFTLIDENGEKQVMEDNAFYMYVSNNDRGFYIFPYADFQWLPMAMNGGIMSHEFTHSVFDALVEDPNRQLVRDGMTLGGSNLLYGINEGTADYMAVARTGDPDYMEHSVEKNVFGAQCNSNSYSEIVRDASIPWTYTSFIDDAAHTVSVEEFCPYDIGAFFASTLYGIAEAIDPDYTEGAVPSENSRKLVARALFEALGDLSASLKSDFELWDIFSHLIERLGEENRPLACEILSERYAMYYSQVEGC